jgi:ABC-2 type transport system permease protein
MKTLLAAISAELLKIRRSRILWATLAGFALAPIMGSLFVIVLRDPTMASNNPLLQGKAQLASFQPDWPSFFNLLAQAVGVGGLILFGFAASWVFGREYADRTAKDLFVLPLSPTLIVIAKLVAVIAWCLLLTVSMVGLGLALGTALQLPDWSMPAFGRALGSISLTWLLAVALCPPVAFVASAGRGYLAPLGFVILSMVLAQIIGALGLGPYFPWAVPGMFSGTTGAHATLDASSYALVVATCAVGLAATIYWWQTADQTK